MKKVVLLGLVVGFLASCASDLRIHPNEVDDALNAGDFANAIGFYREALATDPEDPTLLEGYYSAYERIEDYYLGCAALFGCRQC